MGKSKDQIELEIKAQREALNRNLHELEVRAKAFTHWQTYFAKSPAMMLGLAFGCGVVIAALSGNSKPIQRERAPRPPSPAYDQVQETWGNVKGALIGVAAMRLMDFVSELLPGFKEQIDLRESKKQV